MAKLGRAVVAVEADELRTATLHVVRELGLEGVGVADGDSAYALVASSPRPVALIIDVGLPGRPPWQLAQDARVPGPDAGARVAVILVASVYSRTAYKRRPASLHGADDYVEQHHVPDQLPAKLRLLVSALGAAPGAGSEGARAGVGAFVRADDDPVLAERLRRAGEGRLAFRYTTAEEAQERARRLAEIVVADVLLYAGAEVDRVRTRAELEQLLADDLRVARELVALRVPASAGLENATDLVGLALEAHVARLSSKMDGPGS